MTETPQIELFLSNKKKWEEYVREMLKKTIR